MSETASKEVRKMMKLTSTEIQYISDSCELSMELKTKKCVLLRNRRRISTSGLARLYDKMKAAQKQEGKKVKK